MGLLIFAFAAAIAGGAVMPMESGAQQTATAQGVRVWVNTASSVYHCPGTQWYGATKRGEYMTQSEATRLGSRPAYGRGCAASPTGSTAPIAQSNIAGTTQGVPNRVATIAGLAAAATRTPRAEVNDTWTGPSATDARAMTPTRASSPFY